MTDNSIEDGRAAFTAYEVGQVSPFWTKLPNHAEGMTAIYNGGDITVIVLLRGCSDTDVSDFRNNPLKFGLLPLRGGYAWLLWNGVGVFDMPYTPWLEHPGNRELSWSDDLGPETRLNLQVHLLDERGTLRTLRLASVSPHFTKALARNHRRALQEGEETASSWTTEVARFNSRYRTPNEAFKDAAATSKGGE